MRRLWASVTGGTGRHDEEYAPNMLSEEEELERALAESAAAHATLSTLSLSSRRPSLAHTNRQHEREREYRSLTRSRRTAHTFRHTLCWMFAGLVLHTPHSHAAHILAPPNVIFITLPPRLFSLGPSLFLSAHTNNSFHRPRHTHTHT